MINSHHHGQEPRGPDLAQREPLHGHNPPHVLPKAHTGVVCPTIFHSLQVGDLNFACWPPLPLVWAPAVKATIARDQDLHLKVPFCSTPTYSNDLLHSTVSTGCNTVTYSDIRTVLFRDKVSLPGGEIK